MTRIRYRKENKSLRSHEILCGTKFVQIYIDLVNLSYCIDYFENEIHRTLRAGYSNTLASLKRKAKRAVIDLGATFYQEIRNRGKTERHEM